jgi:hypothetical protein
MKNLWTILRELLTFQPPPQPVPVRVGTRRARRAP